MFERYTEKALKAVLYAQDEARLLGWNFVSGEFLLIGLIDENTGAAALAMQSFDLTYKALRITLRELIGVGPGNVSADVPFTPRAKKILEIALLASEATKRKMVDTGHLLIAVIEDLQIQLANHPNRSTGTYQMLVANSVDPILLAQKVTKLFCDNERPDEDWRTSNLYRKDLIPVSAEQKTIPLFRSSIKEASRLRWNEIGTEILLLGIIAENSSNAAVLFEKLGVELTHVREIVQELLGFGTASPDANVYFTARTKRVLDNAWNFRKGFEEYEITTDHIMLSLLNEIGGGAAMTLQNLGVNPEEFSNKLTNSKSK